ncbi:MAG: hypothetical protein KGL39_59480 [Patescibacteria group bacterium]|nr:hypothetical protein [Patescibacteria group bacterium]
MATKFGFKRIAKEPLKPAPAPPKDTAMYLDGVKLPSQEEVAKMTPEEAYKSGQELGEAFKKAEAKLAARAQMSAVTLQLGEAFKKAEAQKAAPTRIGTATTLFKKSDTGIGHKQWSIWKENTDVVVEWGHCDKKKQQKRYPFMNRPHLMANWIQEAIRKKIKEGYKSSK